MSRKYTVSVSFKAASLIRNFLVNIEKLIFRSFICNEKQDQVHKNNQKYHEHGLFV